MYEDYVLKRRLTSAEHSKSGVDTLIRVHDIALLPELDRAVFSLFHQSYQLVAPIIITQDLQPNELESVASVLDQYSWLNKGVVPQIVNVPNPSKSDIRSTLLNAGLEAATGRFLTILDADDYLYGNAIEWLVSSLDNGRYAISFGDIVIRHVAMIGSIPYAFSKAKGVYKGNCIEDLLHENFCPIHSFVLDSYSIAPNDLVFCEKISRLEDYEFLLRICSKYPANFASRTKVVGVYNWKSDGSNSTIIGSESAEDIARKNQPWEKARLYVEETRKAAIELLSSKGAVKSDTSRL